MGAYPSAAAQAQPFDPLAQQAKRQQVQAQQQGLQANALDIQAKQRDMQDQQTVMQVLGTHGGDLDSALPELASKVTAKTFLGLQKAAQETKKTTAELDNKTLENNKMRNDALLGLIGEATKLPPDQYAQAWPEIASRAIAIDPRVKDHINPAQPVPPQALAQYGLLFQTQSTALAKEAAARAAKKAEEDSAAAAAELPGKKAKSASEQLTLQGTNAQGMTAEQQATTAQGAQRLKYEGARLAEERRHNQASEGTLTPESLSMAAQQYAQTGVMPAVGRTGALRSQIMNEAARVYPKVDIASNAASFKANQESLKKLQVQTDQVEAFENTAGKNLDLFLTQAKKVIDTGSPWINRPLRLVGQQGLGSADLAAMNAARQIAINEVAKVTANPGMSGQLSDTARKEVEAFNPQDATFAQTVRVASVLKQDMANRKQSNLDQIADIKKRIGGGSESTETKPTTGRRVIDLTK